jgi:hypothetical protein
MATVAKLEKDIASMQKTMDDPSTPDSIKDAIRDGLENAKRQLAELKAKGAAPKQPRIRTTEKKPKKEPKEEPKKAVKKEPKKPAKKAPRKRTTAKKPKKKGGLSDRALKRIAAAKKRRKQQGLAYSTKVVMKDAERVAAKPGREKRDNRVDYATGSYPYLEHGGEMAKGGLFGGSRIKSATNRDRAYKSEEPWEKKYVRKTKPKNPRYNRYGDGGETHRNG